MTSSNGNIFRSTGHLCGEFTGHRWIPRTQRPVTRSIDVFFDLRFNRRLSKQSRCWWFKTPSRPLWRHCNGVTQLYRHLACWATCLYFTITRYRYTTAFYSALPPSYCSHGRPMVATQILKALYVVIERLCSIVNERIASWLIYVENFMFVLICYYSALHIELIDVGPPTLLTLGLAADISQCVYELMIVI